MQNKRRYINEDITSNEVRSIVNSKLNDFLKEREFEKRVNELSTKVLEKFITQLFNKRLMWTSSLKNESGNITKICKFESGKQKEMFCVGWMVQSSRQYFPNAGGF